MNRTIYTFWEPKEQMLPYIKLCMEKWKPFIAGFEHVLLDYSNLFDHIPEGSLDIQKIGSVSLSHQKDIIQASVLKYNGGIFIDADMLFSKPLDNLMHLLNEYEVVTFSYHLAFMMAQPESKLIDCWHSNILKKFNELEVGSEVNWDYFGNSIINNLLKSKKYSAFRIDKFKTAFTPELNHFNNNGDVTENYLNFWFSAERSLSDIFYRDQCIIALHNSWTPEWYKKMSDEELLADECLLSRLIQFDIENARSIDLNDVSWNQYLRIYVNSKIKGIKRRAYKLLGIEI